uniref:12.2 kDa putative secretory protein n=1 Tax=Argas monolakensis TaxID=34602 RepID=Q09JQ0_ARGMO|nr:12.2 kDa putative secretory protein [Argas monolakensis]
MELILAVAILLLGTVHAHSDGSVHHVDSYKASGDGSGERRGGEPDKTFTFFCNILHRDGSWVPEIKRSNDRDWCRIRCVTGEGKEPDVLAYIKKGEGCGQQNTCQQSGMCQ